VQSLTAENERLARDNVLLLNELTRVRKLYDDVVLFVQYQARMAMQGAFVHPQMHNPMAAYASLMQHMPASQSPSGFSTVDYDGKGKQMFPGYGFQSGHTAQGAQLSRSKSEGVSAEEGLAQHFPNPFYGYPGYPQALQHFPSVESVREERGPKLFGVCLDTGAPKRGVGDEGLREGEKRVKREVA
jgi:hypothetical protein